MGSLFSKQVERRKNIKAEKKTLCDLNENCGESYPGSDYRPADRKNWMAGLGVDKVHINKIVWPGTHDSATNKIGIPFITRPFAQCQSLSVYQQLVKGTRVLDIRVNENRRVCHGVLTTYGIDVVIGDIKKFLSETQSEVIILEIRTEFGHQDPPEFEKYLEEQLGEYLIHQDEHVFGKTIAEVLPKRIICVWKPQLSRSSSSCSSPPKTPLKTMNSLAKFAASQSHNASRRWLASQLFTTSTAAKLCSKFGIPSDTKSPTAQEWPRPSKIPYQPKAANSVTLAGYINMPVQFEAASDGKFWAGTVISQNPSYDSPPLWIPIIFEGDLAHVAACHLKENDHVYIDGQLSADPPSNATRNQASVQVMVRAINFVDESSPKTKSIASVKTERTSRHSDSTGKDAKPAANPWRDLLDNPKEWNDYREHKLNGSVKPKYPDFKRKDGVLALWLDSAPEWVVPKLEGLKFDIPKVKPPKDLVDRSWKDLVENPNKWWDNRLQKINGKVKEKYPDFKHKETGIVLWVSDMPTWAESKLPPLNSKKWSGNP